MNVERKLDKTKSTEREVSAEVQTLEKSTKNWQAKQVKFCSYYYFTFLLSQNTIEDFSLFFEYFR